MNITLDDGSPQIGYYSPKPGSGSWFQNHTNDDQVTQYFRETFMGTRNDGDYMFLKFNGTAIYVYGSKRFNHGAYSAQLDGGNVALLSGYSRDSQHQSLLYSAGGLSADREHELTMTNLPSQTSPPGNVSIEWWLDIDNIVITAAATGQVYTTTIDDSSSMVSYSSGGRWNDTIQPSNSGRYYNATSHFTSNPGDSFTLNFKGTSAQLFGCLNFDHGNYTANVDGLNWPLAFNGSWYRFSCRQSLFVVSGLADGPHTVTLRNTVAGRYGNFLDFDYAIVNSTTGSNSGSGAGNPTGTNSTTTPANGQAGSGTSTDPQSGQSGSGAGQSGSGSGTSPGSGNGQGANAGSSTDANSNGTTNSKSSTGPIVGGVVGGIVAVLVIAFAAFWFYRKRKRAAEGTNHYDRAPLGLNGDEVKPYVDPESPVSVVLYPHSASTIAPASQTRSLGGMAYAPPVLNIPPPPPSNVTSYPLSAYTAGSDNGSPTTGRSGSGSHPYENPFGSMSAASFGGRGTPSAPASNQTASSAGDYFGRSDTPQSASAASASRSPISPAGLRPQSQLELDIKRGDGNIQPFTARSVSQWSSTSSSSPDTAVSASARSNRMQVHGREVDLGPVPEDELLEGAPMSPLPPNYEQATEPLRPKTAPDA